MNFVQKIHSLLVKTPQILNPELQQIRNKYVDARMIRDVKRRKMAKEHSIDRLRLLSLKRNNIIPVELREEAAAELHAFPRDSNATRIVNRCAVTSRPRGVVIRWRLSRIVFRHLADYNKMAGIQRAMW